MKPKLNSNVLTFVATFSFFLIWSAIGKDEWLGQYAGLATRRRRN